MRPIVPGVLVLVLASAPSVDARAEASKPWCGPDVTELSDHVCFVDGTEASSPRRTLVIFLHGALATTPGFQYVQQNAMAVHAKRLHFAVVLPTAPLGETGYVWPTSQVAQREQEPFILASIAKARHDASIRAGHPFDETFVVGFSSGAYFGSSLAVREALNVDGYMILAGGSSWARNSAADSRHARSPVFVGVSAADPQTRAHSRSFGATLHALGWPAKIEERNAGHNVDWTFMDHGIRWLRERRANSNAGNQR